MSCFGERLALSRDGPHLKIEIWGTRLAAVVVGPDDFVDEGLAAEDGVEEDLGVVGLAVVDVEEERAGGGEEAVGFFEARADEGGEVVECVGVGG